RGDLGELIVWHELGHSYLTNALTLPQIIELYTQHEILFIHLQEFFADLTSAYHTSPRGIRAVLQARLDGLDAYDDDEPHTRAAPAIGALVVRDMLLNPDDWPSVHFPPKVLEQQVELNTIIYVYETWDRDWSVAEERRLRELVGAFVRREGDATFRRRGTLNLPGGGQFKLMVAEDRGLQAKRDQWTADRLKRLIDTGRADTLAADAKYEP